MVDVLQGVSLAFSLHAATQTVRQKIVPSASAYKLDEIMSALDDYMARTEQKVFIEYVMLADINDGVDEANQVGALLENRNVVLNLIPFNPVYAKGVNYQPPKMKKINKFQSVVEGFGVRCTVRQEKGQDIAGE